MKLRTRLGLTAALVIAPMVGLLVCFDAIARHRAAEQLLTEMVSAQLPMERERCEASPESWGGRLPGPAPFDREGRSRSNNGPREVPPGGPHRDAAPGDRGGPPGPRPGLGPRARPAVAFAYDDQLRSRNAAAPPIAGALATAIANRESAVEPFAWRSREVEVLLRTPWGTGPCAFVLAQGTTGEWGAVLPETQVWALPMLAVVAAVFFAMGPVVRRIRHLTEDVRRSASASYDEPIGVAGNDEIGELAKAFDVAGRQIASQLRERERREKALREFVANTTHDVMIPLTVLQGHLATLRDGAAQREPTDGTIVSFAMDEAHYLASLVHNLATAARLEGVDVKLQPSSVDVGALVTRVVARHMPIARERQVTLESASPAESIHSWADLTLLEQAISNITYNAVRYNRPGGHVAVILEAVSPDRFCVRVVDDGPGIHPKELTTIAERGVRGEKARTRAPEGQGLGLHIAYRAAELHGFHLGLGPSEYGGLEARLEGTRETKAHV